MGAIYVHILNIPVHKTDNLCPFQGKRCLSDLYFNAFRYRMGGTAPSWNRNCPLSRGTPGRQYESSGSARSVLVYSCMSFYQNYPWHCLHMFELNTRTSGEEVPAPKALTD